MRISKSKKEVKKGQYFLPIPKQLRSYRIRQISHIFIYLFICILIIWAIYFYYFLPSSPSTSTFTQTQPSSNNPITPIKPIPINSIDQTPQKEMKLANLDDDLHEFLENPSPWSFTIIDTCRLFMSVRRMVGGHSRGFDQFPWFDDNVAASLRPIMAKFRKIRAVAPQM